MTDRENTRLVVKDDEVALLYIPDPDKLSDPETVWDNIRTEINNGVRILGLATLEGNGVWYLDFADGPRPVGRDKGAAIAALYAE
ncbi:hypothetical protein [Streptomyces phytophilus]|uniref:hypothetical protein n=1 Tax=Streptomyces phytophilus TaxID=722715 RepID=UPI001C688B53|nr:hypothetical protein [Streptomyces phytophilus]